ncbi:MAG: hypothetical protein ACTSVW_00100 [Candidatus Njordarchaeales archaeon]
MEGYKLRNIILYYLLSAVKELGVNLPLLFRRISEHASKDIDYLSKEFFEGKMHVENFEQLIQDIAQTLKQEGVIEDFKVTVTDNNVDIEAINCSYLDMAEKGKSRGEPGCPICLISLAASIASTVVKGHSFNISKYESDVPNKKCQLKITYTTS